MIMVQETSLELDIEHVLRYDELLCNVIEGKLVENLRQAGGVGYKCKMTVIRTTDIKFRRGQQKN